MSNSAIKKNILGNSNTKGRIPESYTRFSKGCGNTIKFRIDSLEPWFWIEGELKPGVVSKDGFTQNPVLVRGRTSIGGPICEIYAKVMNWTLRLDDANNLPFWAEVFIPKEFQSHLFESSKHGRKRKRCLK
jgi:hypothetical protein